MQKRAKTPGARIFLSHFVCKSKLDKLESFPFENGKA